MINVQYALLGKGIGNSGSGSNRFETETKFVAWLVRQSENGTPVCITEIEYSSDAMMHLLRRREPKKD